MIIGQINKRCSDIGNCHEASCSKENNVSSCSELSRSAAPSGDSIVLPINAKHLPVGIPVEVSVPIAEEHTSCLDEISAPMSEGKNRNSMDEMEQKIRLKQLELDLMREENRHKEKMYELELKKLQLTEKTS